MAFSGHCQLTCPQFEVKSILLQTYKEKMFL